MSVEDAKPDEEPLLPEQRVGAALREARESRRVSLRALARQLGYQSHTTLSGYERGAVMPTEQIVEGYEHILDLAPGTLISVLEEACRQRHGDAWTKRRVHIPVQFMPEEPSPPTPQTPGPPARRRRRTVLIAAAITVTLTAVAVTIASLATAGPPGQAAPPISSPTLSVPAGALDRTDPKVAGCAGDAGNADSVDVYDPPEHLIGVLDLRYSPACGTSWGRFTPTSALASTPALTLEINLHRPADGATAPFQVTYDGLAAYGNMLMSRNECVYAELILHRDGTALPAVRTACRRGAG